MNRNDYTVKPMTKGGRMLQEAMAEHKLTFRDVGLALGVNHTNVHHWVTKRVPMLRWAVRLEELYGVPVESWMEEV